MTGKDLPNIITNIPGPRSKALLKRLRKSEAPGMTMHNPPPIFWQKALGNNIIDVDENRFIDLSAGFGVANIGFCHPLTIKTINKQSHQLIHAMGDVYPSPKKLEVLTLLSEIFPGNLSILGNSGSEAVEIALKTAMLYTKKPEVIAFEGAYHGLNYGALNVTGNEYFRKPFRKQLSSHVFHLPFPERYPLKQSSAYCLKQIHQTLRQKEARIGAIIIEPIQGRGGIHIAPKDFLKHLRKICDDHHILLIFDEVFTGFGRTGKLFCFQHSFVKPDLLCIGKAMSGGFPISACIGKKSVMKAWNTSSGEALHTSTYQGNPLGCSMALSSMKTIIMQNLPQRAAQLGKEAMHFLQEMKKTSPHIGDVRGKGLMIGIELVKNQKTCSPATHKAKKVIATALKKGIILLSDGEAQNVIVLTPPLTITKKQLRYSLDIIKTCIDSL